MSATPANQKVYPQHCHQKAGCGLPLAKVADSAYGTYVDLAWVQRAKADAVFRKHPACHCDFRNDARGVSAGDPLRSLAVGREPSRQH